MRITFLFIFLALTALVAHLVPTQLAAGSPVISIGSLTLGVGEQGSVDLRALNIPQPGESAWDIEIAYDPAVVSIRECPAGKNDICDPEFMDNSLRIAGTSAAGLVADTTLATLTFRCHGVGSSPLSLTSMTGSIPELILEVQTEDGAITCAERPQATATGPTPTATPLPGLPATGGGAAPVGRGPNWSIAAMGGLGLAIAASFAALLLFRHRP